MAQPVILLVSGCSVDVSIAGLIDIGWEAPAGQLFSSTNDLAKFMALIFQPGATLDPKSGQVSSIKCTHSM